MSESIVLNLKHTHSNFVAPLNRAVSDFFRSIKCYRIWFYLANNEVQQRYRRSALGPWWITLTMLIFILAMGAVFSRIFKTDLASYVPFFTAGYLFWMLISG